jgi:hypothetical protein
MATLTVAVSDLTVMRWEDWLLIFSAMDQSKGRKVKDLIFPLFFTPSKL